MFCPIKSLSFRKFLMTSLHVIYGLALPQIPNPGYACALNYVRYAYQIPVVAYQCCWRTSRAVAYNIAKMQSSKTYVALLPVKNFLGMEWNMEENFSMEWNMEWKIFSMEWKWNGRKLAVWNTEKSSSIPFHTMPWLFLGQFISQQQSQNTSEINVTIFLGAA